jgi:hypothetical protein
MADNYLEKKMEELHNRKAGCAPTRVSPASRHLLTFPFKPLRVLVISRNRHALSQYTKPFQQAGCRVAVVSTIDAAETDLPQDHGCRYYAIGNNELPTTAFPNLIASWRDIDVVVMLDNWPAMTELLRAHAAARPYPNYWGFPVLSVSQNRVTRHDIMTDAAISSPVPDVPDRPESTVLTFLALKSSSPISSITF